MGFLWNMATAGLWPLIWSWGTGIGLIVILIALEIGTYFIPILGQYLGAFRRDLIYAAIGVAVIMFAFGRGEYLEKQRWEAKERVLYDHVQDLGRKADSNTSTDTPDRMRNDRLNRDR